MLADRPRPEKPEPSGRPVERLEDGYTSSRRCVACHPQNVHTWYRSYHRTMTQVATETSVVGAFNDVTPSADGKSYRLFRDDDAYWVELPDGAGRREVVMTTGSHHMQVYWYRGEGRVLEQLPFVWLNEAARWIPRNAAFLRPPGFPHAAESGRWNHTCIRCHSTHGRLGGIDLDEPNTRAVELGIACEACHGAAEEHVAKYRDPVRRYAQYWFPTDDDTIVDPTELSAARSGEVCGQCHGISVFHS